MSALKKWDLVPESDYLARELVAVHKHEYIAGVVYAMDGAMNLHNQIVTNLTAALGGAFKRWFAAFLRLYRVYLRIQQGTVAHRTDIGAKRRKDEELRPKGATPIQPRATPALSWAELKLPPLGRRLQLKIFARRPCTYRCERKK